MPPLAVSTTGSPARAPQAQTEMKNAVSTSGAAAAAWKGSRRTLPQLFAGALADWPNNPFLGTRHIGCDGTPAAWYEWRTLREVQLTVATLGRSLAAVALPGGRASLAGARLAIIGPASAEAAKAWLVRACMRALHACAAACVCCAHAAHARHYCRCRMLLHRAAAS